MPPTDQDFIDCWHRAIDAYATAEIFKKRSEKYTLLLKLLSFTGLVFPALVGAVAMGDCKSSAQPETVAQTLMQTCITPATVATAITIGNTGARIVSLWSQP